jgi:hypothetical protein
MVQTIGSTGLVQLCGTFCSIQGLLFAKSTDITITLLLMSRSGRTARKEKEVFRINTVKSSTNRFIKISRIDKMANDKITPNDKAAADPKGSDLAAGLKDLLRSTKNGIDLQMTKEFDGYGITSFLDSFEEFIEFRNPNIDPAMKKKLLLFYVVEEEKQRVKVILESWDHWSEVVQALKRQYRSRDPEQLIRPEEKLRRLNATVVAFDQQQIATFINAHRLLCQKINPAEWSTDTIQSRYLLRALPSDLIFNIAHKEKKTYEELERMEYKKLWAVVDEAVYQHFLIMNRNFDYTGDGIGNEFMARERYLGISRPRSNQPSGILGGIGADGIDQINLMNYLRKQKKKEEEVKSSKVEKRVGFQDLQREAAQLVQQKKEESEVEKMRLKFEEMRVSQVQMQEMLTSLVGGLRLLKEENMKLNLERDGIMPRLNSLALKGVNDREAFDQTHNISVNAAYSSRGPQGNCWYCGIQGHYPQDCQELKMDSQVNDWCHYDSKAQSLLLGKKREPVPPRIITFFQQRSCVRRLAVFWVKRFPKCDPDLREIVDNLIKRESSHMGRWVETPEEEKEITYYLNNVPGWGLSMQVDPDEYRKMNTSPRYADDNSVPTPRLSIIDDTDVPRRPDKNRMFEEEGTVRTFSLEGKRQRTDLAGTARTTRSNDNKLSEDQRKEKNAVQQQVPASTQGSVDESSPRDKEEVIRKIAEEIRSKKLGIRLDDLIKLEPSIGDLVRNLLDEAMAEHTEKLENTAIRSSRKIRSTTLQLSDEAAEGPAGAPRLDNEELFQLIKQRAEITDPELLGMSTNHLNMNSIDQGSEHVDSSFTILRYEDGEISAAHKEVISVKVPTEGLAQRSFFADSQEWEDSTIQVHTASLDQFTSLHQVGRLPAESQDLPFIPTKIGSPQAEAILALVDSGAEGNIMTEDYATKFGLRPRPAGVRSTQTYSGDRVPLIGKVEVNLYFGSVVIPQVVYIVEKSATSIPFLLGMPFFRTAKVTFDHSDPTGNLLLRARVGNTGFVVPVAGGVRYRDPTRNKPTAHARTIATHAAIIEGNKSIDQLNTNLENQFEKSE